MDVDLVKMHAILRSHLNPVRLWSARRRLICTSPTAFRCPAGGHWSQTNQSYHNQTSYLTTYTHWHIVSLPEACIDRPHELTFHVRHSVTQTPHQVELSYAISSQSIPGQQAKNKMIITGSSMPYAN